MAVHFACIVVLQTKHAANLPWKISILHYLLNELVSMDPHFYRFLCTSCDRRSVLVLRQVPYFDPKSRSKFPKMCITAWRCVYGEQVRMFTRMHKLHRHTWIGGWIGHFVIIFLPEVKVSLFSFSRLLVLLLLFRTRFCDAAGSMCAWHCR